MLQDSSILPGYLAGHIRNSPIGDLNHVGVDDRGQNIVFGEISYNFEEFCTNVGLDIETERRIEVDAVTRPGSVLLLAGIYLMIFQPEVVSSSLQSLLIWRSCSIKYFLIGREFAQPVIDILRNVSDY